MPPPNSDAEENEVPSYLSVSENNTRVRWFRESSLVSFVRRAVIYEVRSTRPQVVLIPARDDWDPACGSSASSEDLDTDRWFGRRQVLDSVYAFPGTDCRLVNSFDIITLHPGSSHVTQMANSSIRRLFDTDWKGNLMVIKRGRYDYNRAINISRSEVSLINALVERWLQLRIETMSDDDMSSRLSLPA